MTIIGSGIAYADIDSIPEELINIEYDIDKSTGKAKGYKKPAKKKWTVEKNGIQFEVVPKVQRTLNGIWNNMHGLDEDDEDDEEYIPNKYYDPTTLLELCGQYNIGPLSR